MAGAGVKAWLLSLMIGGLELPRRDPENEGYARPRLLSDDPNGGG